MSISAIYQTVVMPQNQRKLHQSAAYQPLCHLMGIHVLVDSSNDNC